MDHSVPRPARVPYARRDGFALIITITLLALLVLVLVSLATFTRVETSVAANSQKSGQAKQHALLGLNVALGQLQRYAGPDQRVTAPSSIGDSSNLSGVPASTDGKRHWTGVWGSGSATGAETATPVLLNWLVSGNENAAFSAVSDGPPYSGVTGIAHGSTGEIGQLTASSGALSELGTASQPWRLLTGPGSVGSELSRYVAAPLVPIEVPESQVPGLGSGTGDVEIGGYAWWVGDEGVKAKVSLVDPIAGRANDTERNYSFIAAQRYGIERVRDADDGALGGLYPVNDGKLGSVLSLQQFSFIGSDNDATDALRQVSRTRFHDLTAASASVLADAAAGGLKKDLTAWTGIAGSEGPADTDPIVAGSAGDHGMPQWGVVRSYAATVADGQAKAPVAQTKSAQGISPVITHARLGFGVSLPGANDNPRPGATSLRVLLFPSVVLWNPTNVPIRGEYEVAIAFRDDLPYVPFILAEEFVDAGGVTRHQGHAGPYFFVFSAGRDTNGALQNVAAQRRFYRFKIEETEIPPGQSLLFALKEPDLEYEAGATVLAPLSAGADETASAYIATNLTVAANSIPATSRWLIKWGRGDEDAANKARWSSTAGKATGALNVVLRPLPAAGAPELPVRLPAPVDGAYQTVQHFPFTRNQPVGFAVTTDPDAFALSPFFVVSVEMQMGATTFASELPWLKHLNPRALQSLRTIWNGTEMSALYRGAIESTSPDVPAYAADGRLSAGAEVPVTGGNPVDMVLSEFRPAGVPLFSLAQLQHANLSLLQIQPAYAVGNSAASPFVPRATTRYAHDIRVHTSDPELTLPFRDHSWHLNRALWDRHYFSTVPATGSGALSQADIESDAYRLPNGRMRFHFRNGSVPDHQDFKSTRAYSTNAANLVLDGGFNVNSTSVDAWRALLAGLNGVAYDPRSPADGTASLEYPFSRYASPAPGVGSWTVSNQPWGGYRELTPGAIDGLAQRIVDEIRRRGPFLSLADFVNRRIAADDTGLAGVIQAALDAQDTATGVAVADRVNREIVPFSTNLGPTVVSPAAVINAAEAYGGATARAPVSSRAAFSPGYLTQADILTAIGSSLAVRSDTFVIRSYGEVKNPVTGEIDGRAWCEAIVQRVPDFMNPVADSPEVWPPTDPLNQTFGRQFRVVSFRWLSPSEI